MWHLKRNLHKATYCISPSTFHLIIIKPNDLESHSYWTWYFWKTGNFLEKYFLKPQNQILGETRPMMEVNTVEFFCQRTFYRRKNFYTEFEEISRKLWPLEQLQINKVLKKKLKSCYEEWCRVTVQHLTGKVIWLAYYSLNNYSLVASFLNIKNIILKFFVK